MNSSAKTVTIAEGIFLYAKLMDEPAGYQGPHRLAWDKWCERVPVGWMSLAMQEQGRLFDVVNAQL